MVFPVYPLTLPTFQTNSFSMGVSKYNTIATDMDSGPQKIRATSRSASIPVKGQIYVSLEQLQVFKDFFNDTLIGGTQTFEWIDPITKDVAYFRFTDLKENPPSIKPLNNSGIVFVIDLNLMMLP